MSDGILLSDAVNNAIGEWCTEHDNSVRTSFISVGARYVRTILRITKKEI